MGSHEESNEERQKSQSAQGVTDGEEVDNGACERHVGKDEHYAVAVGEAEGGSARIRLQQHEANGNEIGAPCYGPCLIWGQPERVGHEHEAEEKEEEDGHGVAHPLLFIAEHEGEGVYDEDGEER